MPTEVLKAPGQEMVFQVPGAPRGGAEGVRGGGVGAAEHRVRSNQQEATSTLHD